MGYVTTKIEVVDDKGKAVSGALVSITNISGNIGGKTDDDGEVTVKTADIGLNVKVVKYGNSWTKRIEPGGVKVIMLD